MVTGVNRAFEVVTEAGFVYGQSEAILAVNAIVGEISRTDIPVLLQGESGTGKDAYGRLIHELSKARELPLVKLVEAWEPGELLARVKIRWATGMASHRKVPEQSFWMALTN
jgi:DNA-binding NtrC family response regulator